MNSVNANGDSLIHQRSAPTSTLIGDFPTPLLELKRYMFLTPDVVSNNGDLKPCF